MDSDNEMDTNQINRQIFVREEFIIRKIILNSPKTYFGVNIFDGEKEISLENPEDGRNYGCKLIEAKGHGWIYCYVEGYSSCHYSFFSSDFESGFIDNLPPVGEPIYINNN
jgi:hypothetical protein